MVGFSKYEFNNKLLDGVTFFRVTLGVTWIGLTALFCIIHGSYCTISVNFYFYLLYFQQKVFSFSKISRSQTDPTY